MSQRTHTKPASLIKAIGDLLGLKNPNDEHRGFCRVCDEPVEKGRRFFCGSECARRYGSIYHFHVRDFVAQRDKGVCAHCGLDVWALVDKRIEAGAAPTMMSRHLEVLVSIAERATRDGDAKAKDKQDKAAERAALEHLLEEWGLDQNREYPFDADHIVPFESWNGNPVDCNAPDNLQLLCIPCHRAKTAREAGKRAHQHRTSRKFQKHKDAMTLKFPFPKGQHE